jgi:hypothetical protein
MRGERKEPGDWLYVADERGRVVRVVSNEKHHQAVARASGGRALAFGLLVLCFETLCGAACGVPGSMALTLFVGAAVVYVGFSAFLMNEVEGGILCAIVVLLSLVGACGRHGETSLIRGSDPGKEATFFALGGETVPGLWGSAGVIRNGVWSGGPLAPRVGA